MAKHVAITALLVCLAQACSVSGQIRSAGGGRSRQLQQDASNDIHPWGTLLGNAYYFYEAQQSGVLPSWNRVKRTQPLGWRDNAHITDGADKGVNASGGFYDAGDHMRYTLPFTAAFATLGLGALMHEDGYRAAGEWDNMARNYWWAADYLMRIMDPDNGFTITQVGDTGTDHAYWGRPEQQVGARPIKNEKTGDTLAGSASVLTAAALILSKPGAWQNATFASLALARARKLLPLADTSTGLFSDTAYVSSASADEIALGYLFLCLADLPTAQAASGVLPSSCKTAMNRYTTAANNGQYAFSWDWDDEFWPASALLQLLRPTILQVYGPNVAVPTTIMTPMNVATAWMARTYKVWLDTTKTCPGYQITADDLTFCYTKGGMVFIQKWGTLRHTLNGAFGITLHAKAMASTNTTAARVGWCFSRSQLIYAAGANPANQSYIIGYTPAGKSAADRPHHRSASCNPDYSVTCDYSALTAPGPSPSVLKGGLVGGPNNLDVFDNDRSNYVENEVALDYNGGFTSTLAGMAEVTAQLSAAGCSWDSYCSGGCDSAVTSGAQVVVPAPSPPPGPALPPPNPPSPGAPPAYPNFVALPDQHPWSMILGYSYLFYEAQQSGNLPAWNRIKRTEPLGWRDDAHYNDGLVQGVDASGGFYDAGDHVKYLLPMSQAFCTLAIGALFHEEGYRAAGEWDNMARNLQYAADYLLKIQDPDGGNMFTQVGVTTADHNYWGRPEQQGGTRPLKAETTADTSGNTAAVLAGVAMILRKSGSQNNPTYAQQLMDRAHKLLTAADGSTKVFQDSAYMSSGYTDEVALGYLMVCWADMTAPGNSGMPSVCNTAFSRYSTSKLLQFTSINWDWDNAFFAASAVMQLLQQPLMAANGGSAPTQVADAVSYMTQTLSQWQDTSKTCPTTAFDGNFKVCYSAGGFPYLTKWGSLRHAMNAAFGATLQAKALSAKQDVAGARTQWCWARGMLMYAAGGNPAKQSYIVGYTPGDDEDSDTATMPVDKPHHRSSSCSPDFTVTCDWNAYSSTSANPSVLHGGMVGGPDNLDGFVSSRDNYVQNEVALDYNSGFTGVLAGVSWVTSKLSAARCSWSSYCQGGCDSAVA